MKKQLEPTYQEQTQNNEFLFTNLLKDTKPYLWMIDNAIQELDLDAYQSSILITNMLRHAANIFYGAGWGKVTIEFENKVVTFVRGEESNRLQLKIADKK